MSIAYSADKIDGVEMEAVNELRPHWSLKKACPWNDHIVAIRLLS
jgi:hypothetical protein